MKHNKRITAQILGWTLLSLIIGIMITPRANEVFGQELEGFSPLMYGIILLVILGVSAFMWWKMMKKMQPKHIDQVFSFGMGALTSKAVSLFFPELFYSQNQLLGFVVRGICIFGFWYLYLKLIRAMQSSWKNTIKFSPLNNLIMVIALPVAATIIAIDMSPLTVFLVLIVASIYDAWAVWRSKTMIKMAKFFVKRRMVPGIGIPKATERKGFALLGGGDIFFIVFISTPFWTISPVLSAWLSACMFASLVVLFIISEEKKFYPALPFILAGALIGLATMWVACAMGGLLCAP